MDMDDPSQTAWLAAARAVHFASCLLVGGVWAFDRLVAGRTPGPTPGWHRLGGRLLAVATPVAAASGAAWFVLVAAGMSGSTVPAALSPAVLGPVWFQTQFGRAWQAHAAAWACGAVAAAVWARTRRGSTAATVAAAVLVGGLAWASHGGTGPAPAWHRAADVLHLLASAVWPAGLVPLALLLRSTARSTDPAVAAATARLARRFSDASLAAVGLLTATGLVDAYCLIGSVGALFTTAYGRVLTVKLALFAALVALGAVNRIVLVPRLSADRSTAGRLGWSVAAEVVFGTAVVAAVGLLGLIEPART